MQLKGNTLSTLRQLQSSGGLEELRTQIYSDLFKQFSFALEDKDALQIRDKCAAVDEIYNMINEAINNG